MIIIVIGDNAPSQIFIVVTPILLVTGSLAACFSAGKMTGIQRLEASEKSGISGRARESRY